MKILNKEVLENDLREVYTKKFYEWTKYTKSKLGNIEDKVFIRNGIFYHYSTDYNMMRIVNLNEWKEIKENHKRIWYYPIIESHFRNEIIKEILKRKDS